MQALPEISLASSLCLFYVFNGKIKVNDEILLQTGESLLIKNEAPAFKALETSNIRAVCNR
jgi:hypothetical protein